MKIRALALVLVSAFGLTACQVVPGDPSFGDYAGGGYGQQSGYGYSQPSYGYGQQTYVQPSSLGTNTVVGVAGGAVAGGLLGNALSGRHNRGLGTVAGALVGGALGGVVGNATEQRRTVVVPSYPQQQPAYGYAQPYQGSGYAQQPAYGYGQSGYQSYGNGGYGNGGYGYGNSGYGGYAQPGVGYQRY